VLIILYKHVSVGDPAQSLTTLCNHMKVGNPVQLYQCWRVVKEICYFTLIHIKAKNLYHWDPLLYLNDIFVLLNIC